MQANAYFTYVPEKCLTIVGLTGLNRSDGPKIYIICKSMVLLFDYQMPLYKLEWVNNNSLHKDFFVLSTAILYIYIKLDPKICYSFSFFEFIIISHIIINTKIHLLSKEAKIALKEKKNDAPT